MCRPTAVLVTNVPMPASVLPNQSRANGGLTRSGVRSTRCDRRVAERRGASGPGGASVTERNYATARSPDGAGRHASTSRSREPSRTHTQPSVGRAPGDLGAHRAVGRRRRRHGEVAGHDGARARRRRARRPDPGRPLPTRQRTPRGWRWSPPPRDRAAGSRRRRRHTTPRCRRGHPRRRRRRSGTRGPRGHRPRRRSGARSSSWVTPSHRPPTARRPQGQPRTVPSAASATAPRRIDAVTRRDRASGLGARSAVLNGHHVVSPTPRHLRVQRQHLQVPHGSRHPPAPRRRRRRLDDRVRVSSSGTGDWHVGEHADPRTVEVLAAHGYDGSQHRAREFDPDEFDDLDLVLASRRGPRAHPAAPRPHAAPPRQDPARARVRPRGRRRGHPRDGRPVVRRRGALRPVFRRGRGRVPWHPSTTSRTSWTAGWPTGVRASMDTEQP